MSTTTPPTTWAVILGQGTHDDGIRYDVIAPHAQAAAGVAMRAIYGHDRHRWGGGTTVPGENHFAPRPGARALVLPASLAGDLYPLADRGHLYRYA